MLEGQDMRHVAMTRPAACHGISRSSLVRDVILGCDPHTASCAPQAYANLGNNTETSRELLLQLAEEACARQDTYSSLPAVAWSLTVAGCLPDPLLRKVLVPAKPLWHHHSRRY